jgi:hypothetical protein
MNKPNSRAFDKIVSVTMAVILMSALTGFIQKSNADELATGTKAEQLAAQIEVQKVKIQQLQLQQFELQRTTFSDSELAALMRAVGFKGDAVREAWAVAKKETHGNPAAFNGNVTTGDHSYGMFQINMLGGLGTVRRDKYGLNNNNELFNPVTNAKIAFQMSNGGEDWSSWKVGSGYNGTDQARYREWYNNYPGGSK